MVNLAQAYLNIQREGCIQFDEFYCIIEPRIHSGTISVEFPSLKTTLYETAKDGDIILHVEELFNFLKQCITCWRKKLEESRRY